MDPTAPPLSPKTLTLPDCWAKTDEDGRPALGVVEHCLHVGSVGREIIRRLSPAQRGLLPPSPAFLIACHDLGKVSPGFLMKCPHWRASWQAPLQLADPEQYEGRHAWVSQRALSDRAVPASHWLIAIGGHHGRYLCRGARPTFGRDIGQAPFPDLRDELLRLLEAEFGPYSELGPVERGARLHWFTGLMILADWIGSNTTWFPFSLPAAKAGNAAHQALEEIGSHRYAVRTQRTFSDLFGLASPRPLQQALFAVMDQPGLYVVEAPMGEGKTEAALHGAFRRWSEGSEKGLYFALPTQLTSDRIHARVEEFLQQAVADSSSLALVHGNAWLRDGRVRPLLPAHPLNQDDEPDPAGDGNRWLADSRRALLAPFGVGTVDQALMSVLPVKFSALRLFALGGKVVVIDEVHSYDPYTSALVDRVVQWLLELGGTVIILSATLTMARRQSLLQAAGACHELTDASYPLITKVASGSGQAVAVPIEQEKHATRCVQIECMGGKEGAWTRRAVEAAEAGACVLIIRNTVALAQETYRLLTSQCRDLGLQIGLVHSRFTQADRHTNEAHWMAWLGKDSSQRPQYGALLLGTQVLEQSVDIDADLLITDLAPTDLILQRLGRLHRHPRPRPAGFAKARCLILTPPVDWQADAQTIEEQLKPHGKIYPPFSLYMAERVWMHLGSISLPTDIRAVLEQSVAPLESLPAGVIELRAHLQKATQAMVDSAWTNDVFKQAGVDDAEGVQTRWKMQPTGSIVVLGRKPEQSLGEITVHFAEGESCSFVPGLFHFPLARLLQLHAIRVPLDWLRDLRSSAPDWLKQHFPNAILAVLDAERNLHPCHGPENSAYAFHYRADLGLVAERITSPAFSPAVDDESWF